MYPIYLEAYKNKRLTKIADRCFSLLESCAICPRKCKVNRLKNELGFCKTGLKAKVYSFLAHHGEEPPISAINGSGTIFFSYCNMSCVYCQNYEFSQLGQGKERYFEELAEIMLKLQGHGCHNINLVTPTHVLPQILKALEIAAGKGLNIPIVYNTSGYELPQIIKLLDGIVDIYLADMRYADRDLALKYSNAPDYPEYNQASIKEMQRQVGSAKINEFNVLEKGLVIRHLVLPNNVSGTNKIMQFISNEVSKDAYISLMSQYLPYHNAPNFKEISRRISFEEYALAQQIMGKYGLFNGWIQEGYALERFAGVNIKPIDTDTIPEM